MSYILFLIYFGLCSEASIKIQKHGFEELPGWRAHGDAGGVARVVGTFDLESVSQKYRWQPVREAGPWSVWEAVGSLAGLNPEPGESDSLCG